MNQEGRLKILVNLLMLLVVFIFVYPFFIMFVGSFKSSVELSANPSGFPKTPVLKNYIDLAMSNGGIFPRSLINSLYISAVYVVCMLFLASLAAFAFAKYQFWGRSVIFVLLMSTIMIPVDVLIPPIYLFFAKIRWLSTYTVQIVPGLTNIMALFLLRQYMISVPNSLLDAAKIDGASAFRIYRSIMLPICVPPLTTVGLLGLMEKWSDYLWPLLMVNNTKKMPVMVVLPLLSTNKYVLSFQYEFILAGCTIATLPILILFLVFNKKLILAVTAGAIKG
jgi:ABC-type glycerol-3-phosphate transport system permease component